MSKTQTAKAKGRRLQQWVANIIIDFLGANPEDIRSLPMGSQGEDVIMGTETRKLFPYSIECKNQEQLTTLYKWYGQATYNSKDYEPLLIIKKNNQKPLAVVDAEYFVKLHQKKEVL